MKEAMKIQRVDHIWITLRDTIPKTPASSVFSLNPAGTPISHTQPERNISFVNSFAKWNSHEQTDPVLNNRLRPIMFPKMRSTAIADHVECLCSAAFSACSTQDMDLVKSRSNCYNKQIHNIIIKSDLNLRHVVLLKEDWPIQDLTTAYSEVDPCILEYLP